jgi:uncharacterized membrane protein YbhN (UPF0104 family)
MLASEQTISEIALPSLDVRALVRRLAVPALITGAAITALILAGGRVHAIESGLKRVAGVSPGWVAAGVALEILSLAAYVCLLALVAHRATRRIGVRESAQITLAGAAATRLLPTAGAGGAALTLWALRRAGLHTRAAGRTLLAFLVLLYSVFLVSIAVSGGVLALGLVHGSGPTALSAFPAAVAAIAIVAALGLAAAAPASDRTDSRPPSRLTRAGILIGDAVNDAIRILRSGDARLIGAIGYWTLDAAVLWAMLHAFGAAPAFPVIVLAYFLGQVANTLPLPGSVSGGMAGVLAAFGVPLELALPAVLAYRTVAVWLPLPVGAASVPGLRTTVARWEREDSATAEHPSRTRGRPRRQTAALAPGERSRRVLARA